MTTKIPVELSSTPGIVDGSNATAITIDSSERVGIGTTSPTGKLEIAATGTNAAPHIKLVESGDTREFNIYNDGSGNGHLVLADSDDDTSDTEIVLNDNGIITMLTGNSERMRIDSSGNVGIGISSPAAELHVNETNAGGLGGRMLIQNNSSTSGTFCQLILAPTAATAADRCVVIQAENTDGNNNQDMVFKTSAGASPAERMRINSSGITTFGTSGASQVFNNQTGVSIGDNNGATVVGVGQFSASGAVAGRFNRSNEDGAVIGIHQAGTQEGTISVSGSTVSYNGFSGNHETSGIASDTLIGTVCSTIDELDTYLSGSKEGQTRADHAKIKVSDAVGDTRVYGVLTNFDREIDNKPIVASVGIGSILVTGSCVGGDLLESNGDGTAKVQDDDIIRSKTIGKVTIGNSTSSVKLVSCVLYCG